MTLARDHQARVRQAKAAQAAKAKLEANEQSTIQTLATDTDKHKLLLTAIDTECKHISSLPQGTARVDYKKQMIKTYLPVIDAYVDGNDAYQNEAMVQVMIWLFDVGDIVNALRIAKIAIEQNQAMPKRFKSSLQTFVADAFLEWCTIQEANGSSIEPFFSEMFDEVMEWPIHDAIKIKYLKLKASEVEKAGELLNALECLNEAERLDPVNAKVKTRKAKLTKAIALQDEMAAAEAAK